MFASQDFFTLSTFKVVDLINSIRLIALNSFIFAIYAKKPELFLIGLVRHFLENFIYNPSRSFLIFFKNLKPHLIRVLVVEIAMEKSWKIIRSNRLLCVKRRKRSSLSSVYTWNFLSQDVVIVSKKYFQWEKFLQICSFSTKCSCSTSKPQNQVWLTLDVCTNFN